MSMYFKNCFKSKILSIYSKFTVQPSVTLNSQHKLYRQLNLNGQRFTFYYQVYSIFDGGTNQSEGNKTCHLKASKSHK